MEQLLLDTTLNIEMGRKARLTIEHRFDRRITGKVFIEMWGRMVDSIT
jgi:hypothetical protein